MRRGVVALITAVIVVLSTATPATAHTVSGVEPTDYESRVLNVRPTGGGLSFRLLDLGNRVQLRNVGAEVVVLGYAGEPYLRVGPEGTFENRRSPAAFTNREPSVIAGDASAVPSWRKIRDEPVARWRDQRTRYEGPRSSDERHVARTWAIELRRGSAPVVISGVVTFIPGPSPVPWIVVVLALLAATVAAAWSPRWGRWLALALAVLLASDVIHTLGTATATYDPLSSQLLRVLVGGIVSTVAWLVGASAIASLQRNHEGGLVAAGGVGLVVAVYSGVTDLGVFTNSQVPSVFPAVTARVAVAAALGLGLGLVGAAIAVIAKDPALRPTISGTREPLPR